ncbi:DUF2970 domain-containing protein [Neptunicella sp. SCSIO 80796]|uniref:DUF2970 domain-containing protein n=1 Tax=Neptunicella plasticusilytica TaxID=3117012 RepID=UPI003A4DF03B
MKNWWRIVKSVAASALGVQSEANRQYDFQQKSILPFLLVGVLFVILFIVTIMMVVNFAVT